MDAYTAELEELRCQLAQMQVDGMASRARELEREAERADMRAQLDVLPRNVAEYIQPTPQSPMSAIVLPPIGRHIKIKKHFIQLLTGNQFTDP